MNAHTTRRAIAFAAGLACTVTAVRAALAIGVAASALTTRDLALILCLTGGLYFCSHVVRSMRLALVAMPLLEITFRRAILLHFFVAPLSLIVPFKIDELVRANELAARGGWARALITLFIDRTMDALVLVGLIGFLQFNGAEGPSGLVALIAISLLFICFAIFALPIALETTQRYIFTHHYYDSSPLLLHAVSNVRELLTAGRKVIVETAPLLMLSTACIWAFELAAAGSLLRIMGSHGSIVDTLALMLHRTDQTWRMMIIGTPVDRPIALLSLAFITPMLLAWTIAMPLYLRTVDRRVASFTRRSTRPRAVVAQRR